MNEEINKWIHRNSLIVLHLLYLFFLAFFVNSIKHKLLLLHLHTNIEWRHAWVMDALFCSTQTQCFVFLFRIIHSIIMFFFCLKHIYCTCRELDEYRISLFVLWQWQFKIIARKTYDNDSTKYPNATAGLMNAHKTTGTHSHTTCNISSQACAVCQEFLLHVF